MRTRTIALSILLFGTTVAAQGGARPEQVAAARALFDEGVALVSRGELAEAAERFHRSVALHPALAARFNLAVVERDLGHWVAAAELFEQLAQDPATPDDVRAECARQARALQPRLARLTIALEGHGEDASVHVDQREIPPAALGVPVPVDPGHHRVEARRRGAAVAWSEIDLAPAQESSLTLVVPLPAGGSILEEWWLWTLVGVLVAGAAISIGVGVSLINQPSPSLLGNIAPGFLVVP